MTTYDLTLAFLMLAAPVGTPEPVPSAEEWVVRAESLRRVAIEQEWLSPDTGTFVERERFQADLDFVRDQRDALADAPRLAEFDWFPRLERSRPRWQLACEYVRALEHRLDVCGDDPDGVLSATIAEARWCRQVWTHIDDARCGTGVGCRRQHAARVRELIGAEAWERRELPDHVPLDRFAGVR